MASLRDEIFPSNYPFNTIEDILKTDFTYIGQDIADRLCMRYHRPRSKICIKVREDMDRERQEREEEERKKQIQVDEEAAEAIKVPVGSEKCIWNQSDLEMIRQVLRKTQEENVKMATLYQISQKDVHNLKDSLKQLEEQSSKFMELAIHNEKSYKKVRNKCNHYKKELIQCHDQVKILRAEVKDLTPRYNQLLKENKKLKLELSNVVSYKNQLKKVLESERVQWQFDFDMKEQSLRNIHDIKINEMKECANELKLELHQEKQQHETCKEVLEHMKKHFDAVSNVDLQTMA